jgi:hypothetical protein
MKQSRMVCPGRRRSVLKMPQGFDRTWSGVIFGLEISPGGGHSGAPLSTGKIVKK